MLLGCVTMSFCSTQSLRLAFCIVLASVFAKNLLAERPKPQLVLLIVVDELRGDMLWRFQDRFGPGGLRYLIEEGIAYKQAYYRHSTTFTASGHATLATGGHAALHGFPGNDWYDPRLGRRVYCVEDDRYNVIDQAGELHTGTSPRNLTSTTFGDELVLATDGRARVFSVSIKDRGAIIPGGHLGKAFWYSKNTGGFITSTYYFHEYPGWVKRWNGAKKADRYQNQTWDLLRDRSSYLYAARDDRSSERSYKHLGRTFPHPLGNPNPQDFYSALRFTPMSDELTLEFAKEILAQESLGKGGATDVLAVSLSASDYIGHAFGPNSLETEDNLLRLDRYLAEFFGFVDGHVGLDQTLIVLSSDRGIDAIPEFKVGLGMAAGRHRPERFLRTINDELKKRLDTQKDLVKVFWNPSLYLNLEVVQDLGLQVEEVERLVAAEILKLPGFALAVTRTDLLAGHLSSGPIQQKVQLAFHPQRSGNVLVVQSPSWYLYPDAEKYSAMHGSPYTYDTYVPILIAGAGIRPQVVQRQVAPQDIAPTITSLLGVVPPSGSTGTPLVEVLGN